MPVKRSKTIFRIVLFIGTAISLFFVPWTILWAYFQPLPTTVQEEVNQSVAQHFDGMIVYIDQKGKDPKTYTAGFHNRAQKIPAKPDALFKIASIGKLYVAVSIAKLTNAGSIDLNKTVADYFPEYKNHIANADKAPIRLLVQHRSGIPNYTNSQAFWEHPPKDKQETLKLIWDQPASFEPDADYEYSNVNYLLLSMLIEKVTGMSRFAYFKQEILEPLELHHTYESINTVNLDDVMSGYYVGFEEDTKTNNYCSLLATAEDVGKFIRALNEGTVFKAGEQAIYNDLYKYEHTGLVVGYQSIAKYHKDLDAVVVQFVNTTNFDGYTWNLGEIAYNRVVSLIKN
ncbi:CubicO group peptidase, beta-lactamase class C family [Pustulibacterium marinum]|uniref:CubicO group peptidase, beta-lactamase class C family n=1 Tax=Pustulibacterium marinum TaxID=1224947 RepID=A0A1I7H6Y8_9FLAO|nr:serine hydrolase domain-containing protein [Pustulibacterium marinum]SFU56471.1 CubicO group peptidase, beta-lactamase class C family [Pustulibacterium marinum]